MVPALTALPLISSTTAATGRNCDGELGRCGRDLGPGLFQASDDDPSGIATYSQAGAQFRFSTTWALRFNYPLMVTIQEISARLGGRRDMGSRPISAQRKLRPRPSGVSVGCANSANALPHPVTALVCLGTCNEKWRRQTVTWD
jgi:hypothetical protein